ncbi:putative ribonuclease-like protein YfkH [Halolactibacillus alkaliphilus]|uniref:Putative ribonuclease-like protein YfkH n=1 Tax=Halolactibacillus alkaliphilus TaxID=442899 RepID=A0A511X264_9BACI|nr:YihY/virulence factor BrkB family protein [Halolactibacillus alkaliphilus]GEN57023.1 putative ribonuclease-like protein YfkH [Halolactibacillus alkaliphilus]GGN71747.1 putative ribonuclease-like protein YfkH [Halolactibacillus alkaliphilus]SFO85319.1 membrane protein [Halolactibacillus alkaliphilus]
MKNSKITILKQFGIDLFKNFTEDEVTSLAAQMAYFFLLSLFPLLIFLVTLVGYFPIDTASILSGLSDFIPSDAMTLIETNLEQVIDSSGGGLLSIGIIGTLWSASNGINAIMRSLNKAYDVEENRSFIVGRLIAILLLISMLVLILVALLLPVFGRALGVYVFSFFGASEAFIDVWNMLRWVISSSIFFIVFLYLYRLAPNAKVYIRDILYGALFATLGFQLASFGFSFYVNNFGNYSATYGSLGGIIIMMFWFYITGIVIITGGEINALTAKYRGRSSKKDKQHITKNIRELKGRKRASNKEEMSTALVKRKKQELVEVKKDK